MGALTSKSYTYKSRPWELRSKDTISLKDPFFPLIRAYMGQQQILRILPVVDEEEWLSDASRFFSSEKIITSCLTKLTLLSEYNIEGRILSEESTYPRRLTFNETMMSLLIDIEREKGLSIILGPESDITVMSAIRKFDSLKKIFKINVINPFAQREINNTRLTLENLKKHSVFLMTSINEIAPLLNVQIQDFVDEDGELFTFNVEESRYMEASHLGSSYKTLEKILSGRILTKLPPLFIIPYYLKSVIPLKFKTFVLGNPVDNCFFVTKKNFSLGQGTNILNLDGYLKIKDNVNRNTYVISPSTSYVKAYQIYIPVLSFWNENRVYKNMFQKINRSYSVLLFKNSSKAMVDFLNLLRHSLLIHCYKTHWELFKTLKKTK